MGIPSSYNGLTLKEFIEVRGIELNVSDSMEMRISLIEHFIKKDPQSLPLWKFELHLKDIDLFRASYELLKTKKAKSVIWIKHTRYKGITDATKLSINQYTAIKGLVKDGQSDVNLHKLAALIHYGYKFNTEPQFNDKLFEEISEAMLSAKVGDIAPTVFFYAKVWQRLSLSLNFYLLRSQMEIENAIESLTAEMHGTDLNNSMTGTTQ